MCDANSVFLIFNEVMTGFCARCNHHGEDGGLPVEAYGGKKEIMKLECTKGNPLAMTAGIGTMKKLSQDGNVWIVFQQKHSLLSQGLERMVDSQSL